MISVSKTAFEPPLQELLGDPIIQLLMSSDGVDTDALLPLLERVRQKIIMHPTLRATQ